MKSEPKISELEARQVAFVSFVGNYMGNAQVFKDLFDKLVGWAGPKGLIGPKTMFLSSYQDDPNTTPPEELRLELCMTIPSALEVSGEIQKKILPGGSYVVMHAELEKPEEYGPAWTEVVRWIEKNGYQIDMSRPSYEIYLNNPQEHPEHHHIIDICMSVKAPMIKNCAACTMPLAKAEDIGATIGAENFCIHCTNPDGSVKTCEEIFQGGVEFFLSTFPDLSKDLAERITRKNMKQLPYWQKDECVCLQGDVATEAEFQEVMKKLKGI